MPYDPVKAADSRSNSPSYGRPSPVENANASYAGQTTSIRPKDRIMDTRSKRGSTSNNVSSPINPPHSPAQARAQQPALQQGLGAIGGNSYNNNSSRTPSDGSSSSLSISAATPVLPKSSPKQSRRTANNTNNHLPPSTLQAVTSELLRPVSPFALAPSSGRSSDSRDNTNSVSSTHRSSRNLSPSGDPNYNLTQTDLTLEGLAQRWYAYQAVMRKHYAEDPFYRRWTKSKWILLLTTILLLGYSCAIFGICLGYMLEKFEFAAVVMEFHGNLIYLAFAGSVLGIAAAIVGLIGIFLENRIWLSVYTLMLWPVFAFYVAVGYVSFRRAKNHLRAHLKDEWVKLYTRDQRLIVQRNLKCCGYQDSSWYGEYDLRCFPMTILPGCEHKYNLFEDKLLSTCWTVAFSIVPFQLLVMIAALLCSNHVDGMLRSARPGLKTFKEEKQE